MYNKVGLGRVNSENNQKPFILISIYLYIKYSVKHYLLSMLNNYCSTSIDKPILSTIPKHTNDCVQIIYKITRPYLHVDI